MLAEAERFGAICANRLEVTELEQMDSHGATVKVRDATTGEEFAIHADNVVNATGVWADQIRPEELHSEAEVPKIAPSRGTHITLAQADLPLVAGAIVPAGEGRSIFALPWLGRSLIGTTDNNYDGDIDHVRPSSDGHRVPARGGQRVLRRRCSARSELAGAYAGVRPLISSGDTRKSVDISRKAELYETSSGLITITGGKLTTWRRMAKLAVDRLVERDGREAPCRTHEIPLGQSIDPSSLTRLEGVPETSYGALAGRYGHAAEQVLAIAASAASWRSRSSPTCPICSPRPCTPRATSRRRRRRRAAAPDPARSARRPPAVLARRRGAAPGRPGDRPRARLGRVPSRARGGAVVRGGRRRGNRWRALQRRRRVSAPARLLRTSGGTLELGERPWLMGIVNATPGLVLRRRAGTDAR